MAEKNNATCSICGKEYHVCLSCKDSIQLAPWKIHTDTSEHYKVYQIIRGLSTGVYSNTEAKAKLKNVDIKDVESFRPHIKKIIKDVLKEEKPVVKTAEILVVEENTIVNDIENIEKQAVHRKKNYKMEVD